MVKHIIMDRNVFSCDNWFKIECQKNKIKKGEGKEDDLTNKSQTVYLISNGTVFL